MSFGMELDWVRTLDNVGGRKGVFGARISGDVMSDARRRWRAVAVRTARGLDWEVGVRILRRKDWWGGGRFWDAREVVKDARVAAGWFAIVRL